MADYAWDSLRPLTQFALDADPYIKVLVFLLSLAIFVISFLAYRKTKTQKLLFVSFAFLFFALKWLVKVLDLFVSPGRFLSDPSENVFEFLILVSLFMAIFKK